MKALLASIVFICVSQVTFADESLTASVEKTMSVVSIQLIADPIEDAVNMNGVIIHNPRLVITNSHGDQIEVGVAGVGMCGHFGYKGDTGPYTKLPYTRTDAQARYFMSANGQVRPLSENVTEIRAIKSIECLK